jgi:hypothetical protein
MISQKVKDIAKVVFAAYAINNFSLPISDSFRPIPREVCNPSIQETMHTDDYNFEYQGDDGVATLDYLKLAHAITSKNIRYSIENWQEDNDDLLNGVGSCEEISKFTYSNFLYLIRKANRLDLSDKVRIAAGEVFVSNGGGGHSWLEVFHEGEWKEYDSTSIDFPRDIKIIPGKIDDIIKDEDVLDLEGIDYNRTASWMYFPKSDRVSISHSLTGILKSRGLSYRIYSMVKNRI